MIISKNQLKYHVANNTESREALQFINFCELGAVSTDGKSIMIVAPPEGNEAFLHGSLEILVAASQPLARNLYIHCDDAKELIGNFTRIGGNQAALTNENDDDKFKLFFENGEVAKTIETKRKQPYNFPDVFRVLSQKPGAVSMCFDAKLLKDFIGKLSAASEQRYIEFRFNVDSDNMVVDPVEFLMFDDAPGEKKLSDVINQNSKARGLIMPCKFCGKLRG